jgi:hypothetical protein
LQETSLYRDHPNLPQPKRPLLDSATPVFDARFSAAQCG